MQSDKTWDTRYEWRAVLLLFIGFGLVGLDRFAINPLFPVMMKDLNLDYQDLGNISAVLALAWGVGSVYMGRLSDKLGRRKILIPSVVVFSLMAGFTGLAGGVASLLVMRVIMGLSEGAFMPPSIAATVEASKPTRRGANFGFQQNGLPVIGLGLGPIIATQVLAITGSWRLTFVVVALPGLVLAYLLYRVIREPGQIAAGGEEVVPSKPATTGSALAVLRYRNIILASVIMICMSGALNVVIAMTPSYLVDYLKVDVTRMGFIMSAIGAGALFLGIALPALSDHIGRKPVMAGAALCAAGAVGLFMNAPADPVMLFLLLTAIAGFGFSVIYINVGPLTMASVPAAVASTAVGIVVGVGEIVGGSIAPFAAGFIANNYGIQHVFGIALGLLVSAALLVLLLREPAREGRVLEAVEAAA